MIVPGSTLPADPNVLNDNAIKPSMTNLMMAAAEMKNLGRLGGTDEQQTQETPPKPAPSHRGLRRRIR